MGLLVDIFTRYAFDVRTGRWRSAERGVFVAKDAVQAEFDNLLAASQQNLATLTRRLYAGELTVPQWEVAMAAEIKDAHLAQAMFARGGRAGMTQVEWGRAGRTIRDQYGYLHNFAQEIADGKVSVGQAVTRANMYGNASGQSYWNEYKQQRGRPEWSALPQLPTTPRAGATACRVNCQCTLEEQEDGIHWVLHPAEHCPDCIDLASNGPYRP